MRLFGFLAGLALVGVVIFTASRDELDKSDLVRLSTGLRISPQGSGPEPTTGGVEPAPDSGAVVVADPPVSPVVNETPVTGAAANRPSPSSEAERPPIGNADTTADAAPEPGLPEAEPVESIPDALAVTPTFPDDRWEAFFTPFRSEASALGFAGFLQRTTGREFVVRRAGRGEYRVWFRLAAGESRPERLAEIEKATGLALAGGGL